jgi:hypothetical protein
VTLNKLISDHILSDFIRLVRQRIGHGPWIVVSKLLFVRMVDTLGRILER